MKIAVNFFTDRSLVGKLHVGQKSYSVCGYSHAAPPVPVGTYQLVLSVLVPSENPLRAELGPKVLLFKSLSMGRIVALHAGHAVEWGVFLATDGSLRVGYDEIIKIANKARKSVTPVTLTVSEREADPTTKLIGVRTSETHIPTAAVRDSVARRRTKGDHWAKLAKHYSDLGCTLCQQW